MHAIVAAALQQRILVIILAGAMIAGEAGIEHAAALPQTP